jgi:hypothetical protein
VARLFGVLIVIRKETAPFYAVSLYSDICRHVAVLLYMINIHKQTFRCELPAAKFTLHVCLDL